MGERIGWLDTARAIGIVSVVVGHITDDPSVRAAAFHFHMPLFFMLSGMVFIPAPLYKVAMQRARTLLLPYVAWLTIVAAADVLVAAVTGHQTYLPWERPAAALARLLLGGTFLVGPFGIFWFVTCLYLVQIAAAAVLRCRERSVLVIAIALFVIAQIVPAAPNPWGVISAPAALFFFIVGALHRRHADRFGRPLFLSTIGAALLSLISRPLDLKIADVGSPVLGMIAALGLCHLLVMAARRLPKFMIVDAVGRASLVIMYVHLTIFYALHDRLNAIAIITIGVFAPTGLWIVLRRSSAARTVLLGERGGQIGTSPALPPASHFSLDDQGA